MKTVLMLVVPPEGEARCSAVELETTPDHIEVPRPIAKFDPEGPVAAHRESWILPRWLWWHHRDEAVAAVVYSERQLEPGHFQELLIQKLTVACLDRPLRVVKSEGDWLPLPVGAEVRKVDDVLDAVRYAAASSVGERILPYGVIDAAVQAEIDKYPCAFRAPDYRRCMTLEEIAAHVHRMRADIQMLIEAIPPKMVRVDGRPVPEIAKRLAWVLKDQEERIETLRAAARDHDVLVKNLCAALDLERDLRRLDQQEKEREEMRAKGITPEFPGKQTSKLEGARDDWAPESREVGVAEQYGEEFEL